MKRAWYAGVVCLVLAGSAFGAEALETKGKLDSVTVYRGQALVTRVVAIPGPAGLREVVVGDLPERVEPGSLYAEAGQEDGVEIRSVLYRERPVGQDVRADVRKLDEQIRGVQDQLAANQTASQVAHEQSDYLSKLEQFTAPTANVEMSKGVLNAETLKTLTNYVFEQRKAIADQGLKLGLESRTLTEQLGTLQRQREQITAGSARTVREAVVFLNLKGGEAGAGAGKMKLRYMVDQATWDPSYNIRADGKGKIMVEYNASIQQQSGEDWTDVSMTLSTATPALVANAPSLLPLTVALASMQTGTKGVSYFEVQKEFYAKKQAIETERNNGTVNFDGLEQAQGNRVGGNASNMANANGQLSGQQFAAKPQADLDKSLNDIAGEQQVAELLAHGGKDEATKWTSKGDEVISVTYDLAARTSLPSRADRQLIQVAALPMKSEAYKLAIPVLTHYVYNEASLVNDSKQVLLAGPVASYMAGQFVGHGEIPTVAIGEQFTVGFGIDSALRASRERMDKGEVVQGGNRMLNYTYRLAVENFGAEPVDVRLMDRLPAAKDNLKETDLRVTFDSPGLELSKDAEYLRSERKKGILRWDVKVPGQATGEKAFSLEYKFTVEYDKQMSLTGMPALAK